MKSKSGQMPAASNFDVQVYMRLYGHPIGETITFRLSGIDCLHKAFLLFKGMKPTYILISFWEGIEYFRWEN